MKTSSGTPPRIAGTRILTVSHLINHAGQIDVQPDEPSETLTATVVARAPGISLAVLELEDESFFDTHPRLPTIPRLPDLKPTIFTDGFPTGGPGLSATRGIFSQIE